MEIDRTFNNPVYKSGFDTGYQAGSKGLPFGSLFTDTTNMNEEDNASYILGYQAGYVLGER